MAIIETVDGLTREELGWELAEIFDELDVSQINEVLAKNVPLETVASVPNALWVPSECPLCASGVPLEDVGGFRERARN